MPREYVLEERLEIPKGFAPNIVGYLTTLVSKNSYLMVKNDNLRGRQYTKGSISEIENKISTADIRELLKKGYLTKVYNLEGYTVLAPHLFVSEYIRNVGLKKPFTVKSVAKDDVHFGHFREINSGERPELIRKGKVIKAPCHPNTFKRDAFLNGYNYSDIFGIANGESPMYIMLGVKDTQFYQVFPTDIYKAIKLTKVEPKKDIVPIEYEITESNIRIVSEAASTNYIFHTKRQFPTYDNILENYITAKKYLKENSVRTLGKKQADEILSNVSHAEAYSHFLKEYDRLFSDLLKLSKELVKVGIVSGGINNNPIYKQALEVQKAMANIIRHPSVRTLLNKNKTFEQIINLQNNAELDRYTQIEI